MERNEEEMYTFRNIILLGIASYLDAIEVEFLVGRDEAGKEDWSMASDLRSEILEQLDELTTKDLLEIIHVGDPIKLLENVSRYLPFESWRL